MSSLYTCPHCAERVDTDLDPGGGDKQDYIEDCPVCCRPNRIIATFVPADDSFDIAAYSE